MFAQHYPHQLRVTSSSSATCSSSNRSKNQSKRRYDAACASSAEGGGEGGEQDAIPANCTRVSVEVKKPLGLILEEDGLGGIVVVEVVSEGNSAKTKLIRKGDKILAISAQIKTRTQDYGGVSVGSGEEMIRLQVQGEKFDAIMAAISSYPSQKTMKIDVLKCQE
jgi:hypothetical protein